MLRNDKSEKRPGKLMFISAWVFLLIGLTFFFNSMLAKKENPNVTFDYGENKVILKPNDRGHYVFTGQINNTKTVFLVDTGATFVSVPLEVANKTNMPKGQEISLNTANGIGRGWRSRIDLLQIGSISIQDVPAVITDGLTSDQALLGMSALKAVRFSTLDGDLIIETNAN